jgi:aspartyl-tRNA(Asn)/glutamyl-tRNA(Gln) amidotransferase subunit A
MLAGLPAISMPFTVEQSNSAVGLPIGIQVIGKAFGEAELFELAHIVEQTVCFADKHQPPQHA